MPALAACISRGCNTAWFECGNRACWFSSKKCHVVQALNDGCDISTQTSDRLRYTLWRNTTVKKLTSCAHENCREVLHRTFIICNVLHPMALGLIVIATDDGSKSLPTFERTRNINHSPRSTSSSQNVYVLLRFQLYPVICRPLSCSTHVVYSNGYRLSVPRLHCPKAQHEPPVFLVRFINWMGLGASLPSCLPPFLPHKPFAPRYRIPPLPGIAFFLMGGQQKPPPLPHRTFDIP